MRRLTQPVALRWAATSGLARGALLVSAGSLTLVLMGIVVKWLGARLPSFELLFFRSFIGFLFVLPLFWRDPLTPLRSKRLGMHFVRGAAGAFGNFCFFWTLTHMLLADAMTMQFSRPLFLLPLAVLFLGERAPATRVLVTLVGFTGILIYARPFTSGFDFNALVGALGALFGALVVIGIKQLAKTEETRVIMFYYAFWAAALSAAPTWIEWVTPVSSEWPLLILMGFLGIAGQSMITTGLTLGDATAMAPLDYSRVLYSAVLGFFLFNEIPGVWSFVGMALILAASLYLVLTERRRKAA
jgi:drug/metabolite transporter (DMT)-like permease